MGLCVCKCISVENSASLSLKAVDRRTDSSSHRVTHRLKMSSLFLSLLSNCTLKQILVEITQNDLKFCFRADGLQLFLAHEPWSEWRLKWSNSITGSICCWNYELLILTHSNFLFQETQLLTMHDIIFFQIYSFIFKIQFRNGKAFHVFIFPNISQAEVKFQIQESNIWSLFLIYLKLHLLWSPAKHIFIRCLCFIILMCLYVVTLWFLNFLATDLIKVHCVGFSGI